MALGVSQDRLNTILGHFELLRDFGYGYAVVEVIDNRVPGIRVPRSTGAPLSTRGLASTNGHCVQAMVSSAGMATPLDT